MVATLYLCQTGGMSDNTISEDFSIKGGVERDGVYLGFSIKGGIEKTEFILLSKEKKQKSQKQHSTPI